MASPGSTGIARRRANVRRGVIAALALLCLVIFTGYFRESDGGPLHDVQSGAAAVVSPIQDVASEAVAPFRDAWGWLSDLRDARDRASALQGEVDALRGAAVDNLVRDQRLDELEHLLEVEALVGAEGQLGGYEPVVGEVIARSFTDWYRFGRVDVGRSDGVLVNSPVVASSGRGAGLVGIVTEVRSGSADVAFITDGRTEVGATVPEAGNYPGLLQSLTPGQLRLVGVPREAALKEGQAVVTAGFGTRALPSPYPHGIPVGIVTSVGRKEVDVEYTVQVKPYVDARPLSHLVVLAPRSEAAKRRAAG
jgi:cell shape-determining protein MreC